MQPIGTAIIGANPDRGWGAVSHVPALTQSPAFALRAVATSRAETAAQASAKFGVPGFSDYRQLLERKDVDLVAVTVKVPLHAQIVATCLAAGKMVYCEWPLGNGTAEAEDLAAMARERAIRTAVGLQARSSPVVRYAAHLVRDGFIGKVLSTSIVASGMSWGAAVEQPNAYNADIRNGATMLTIAAGHALDAIAFTLGEFASLRSVLANRRDRTTVIETGEVIPMTAHDQIAVIGRLESGAVASIHYRGGVSSGTNLLWEINGTDGDLVISGASGHMQITELRMHGMQRARGQVALDRADQNAADESGSNTLLPIAVPREFYWAPDAARGSSFNVAHAYGALAHDLAHGSDNVPDFAAAVRRHKLLDAISAAADD